MTKAERQLIALEKGLRNCRKMLTTMIREISPKSRHAVKDIPLQSTRQGDRNSVCSDDVIEALGNFRIQQGDSGWHVYPPEAKLSPTLWSRIRKVMADNSGTWMTQRQAFVFEEDPFPIFKALGQGKIANKKKDRQAFYTPDDLSAKLAKLADVGGTTVLEPSAGHGALANACRAAGCAGTVCYETDEAAHAHLKYEGYVAFKQDFLTVKPQPHFGRVVMNPPFAKDTFVAHIQHALKFLKPGGRLVAVIPGDMPPPKLTKSLPVWSTWNCLPQRVGAFKKSGTNIKTSILVINLNQGKP